MVPKCLNRLRSNVRSFAVREDGTSAIEFSFILTLFLLPLWIGFTEVAVLQKRTTTLNTTTATVADMISQWPVASQQQMSQVMTTAAYVLGEDTANSNEFTITVMGVVIPAMRAPGDTSPPEKPWARWAMNNRNELSCPGFVALPDNVAKQTAGTRAVIVADGSLVYTSSLGLWDRGPSNLAHRAIYAPRETANPAGPNECSNPNP